MAAPHDCDLCSTDAAWHGTTLHQRCVVCGRTRTTQRPEQPTAFPWLLVIVSFLLGCVLAHIPTLFR